MGGTERLERIDGTFILVGHLPCSDAREDRVDKSACTNAGNWRRSQRRHVQLLHLTLIMCMFRTEVYTQMNGFE